MFHISIIMCYFLLTIILYVHWWFQNLLRCAWAPDGSKVAAGSGDRFVYIWDTTTRRILYKLPGHAGSVNEIDFHPEEPIGKIRFIFKNFYHIWKSLTLNNGINKHHNSLLTTLHCYLSFCKEWNSYNIEIWSPTGRVLV